MNRKGVGSKKRRRLFLRDGGICALCGCDCGTRWHADHIVPVVMGGGSNMENLRTLCVPCHSKETARLATLRKNLRFENRPHWKRYLEKISQKGVAR